ncbi:unnamed protein product [Cuscuta epithymum]|uniref:Carbonic anhydrase n=1 Tax=Cuscuta epithymum TaxID=186058 RepID=A0AAV0F865_9ASTE|nr:unnamed protein product [Cuscuta epithymum]
MDNSFFIILITTLLFLYSSQTISSHEHNNEEAKFSYMKKSENGPEKWGNLNPKYTECSTGKFQSPIDLDDSTVQITSTLGQLIRKYKPAPASIINRGHALQIKWEDDAGKIVINGTDYKLQQAHWHTPSENTVNGKSFDMEMHLVHKNANDELAAVGILYKIGAPDPFLEHLLSHIKTADHEGKELGIINPKKIRYGSKKYYRFIGSLTTPPCSQGVLWTVISKAKTVSKEQLNAIKDAVDEGFQENARPVQPLNGREIYQNQP